MKVGLVGYFGWGNFGDELFFDQWRSSLKEYETVRMNELLAKPYFTSSAVARARNIDAILIGGGDLIRVESLSSLYWNRAWKEKPIIVSGIGVARESNRHRADTVPRLAEFFSSSNILSISARDTASSEWISNNLVPKVQVRTVSDLAFAISEPRNRSRKLQATKVAKPTIGFVFNKSELSPNDTDLWNSLLIAEESGLIKVRLLVLAMGAQLTSELSILRSAGIDGRAETFSSNVEMIKAIDCLDMLFSAKFHGLVVAARLGIPSTSLRTTSKSIALTNSFPSLVKIHEPSRDPLINLQSALLVDRSNNPTSIATISAANELEHVRSILAGLAENRCVSAH